MGPSPVATHSYLGNLCARALSWPGGTTALSLIPGPHAGRGHRCPSAAADGTAVSCVGIACSPSQVPRASLLVASCRISTSTEPGGSCTLPAASDAGCRPGSLAWPAQEGRACTYRTTEPRMKQFLTDACAPAVHRPGRRSLAQPGRAAAHHVRVLGLVHQPDVLQLDVQVLVHRVQRAGDAQVVLQLHGHLRPDQAAARRLGGPNCAGSAGQAPPSPRAS